MRVSLIAAALVAVLAAPAAAGAQSPAPAGSQSGRGGAVATVDRLATNAGIGVLRDGGNAVDAAVAAAAVLGVTEPFSAGIGGGGFMLVRTAEGRVTSIDGREKAPVAMTPNAFIESGRALAFDPARYSGLSVGVPGTVRNWEAALRRYGTLRLRDVLAPAIGVADEGFRVDATFARQTSSNAGYFDDVPSTAALYLDADGTPRDVGTTLKNPDLARTYRRIARLGAAGFYEGHVARAIVAAATRPPVAAGADHAWRPGRMTEADLRRYTAPERDVTRSDYRGYEISGMGPPSSGGTTVAETLNILEGFRAQTDGRPRFVHHRLEASRLAYADRGAFLADSSFADVPVAGLLQDSFAAERRALIGETALTSPVAAGNPRDEPPGETTTHLTVVDKDGMAVAYTFTIEAMGGNGVVVPAHGFLLNNELTDFNYDSTTHPNRVEGGKRPRSSMAPTIVERSDRLVYALGAAGGATIPTTVTQILSDRLDFGATLAGALAAPRASQRNTASTQAEPAFIADPLARMLAAAHGHRFTAPDTVATGSEIGAATAIEARSNGRLIAVAEPVRRGSGSARVVRPEN